MRISKYFLLFLFFCSCGTVVVSKKVQDAASTVASVLKAKSCSLGYNESASTAQGVHSTIVLTIEEPAAIDSAYDHDKATSMAAMLFMQNLSKDDYLGMDRLKIEIKNKNSFERTYDIARLDTTMGLLQLVIDFDKSFQNKDFKGLSKDVDHESISDSALHVFLTGKEKIDSAFGKRIAHRITGFTYLYSEPSKEYKVQFTGESGYESGYVEYKYELSEKRKKFTSIHFRGDRYERKEGSETANQ